MNHRLRPSRGELALATVLAPFCLLALCARIAGASAAGMTLVADDQVAVRLDHATGSARVLAAPGFHGFVPWLQEVYALDKSPNELRFEGYEPHTKNRTPRLAVRASDGSGYMLDGLSLEYAVVPEAAATVLADSGPGDFYKLELVNAFARGILRDEYGRYSTERIVEPEILEAATSAARERLAGLLRPHGLEVLRVSTPQPAFDPKYEAMIERRKVANQEVEHLRAKIRQLLEERDQSIAAAHKDGEILLHDLRAELNAARRKAERGALAMREEADRAHARAVAEGEMRELTLSREAGALEERARTEAEGLTARLQALEPQGALAVRAALVEALGSVRFDLAPTDHSDDADVQGGL